MIAIDTSTLVAYLGGRTGSDVEALDHALELEQVALPPVVLTEVLSARRLESRVKTLVLDLPVLELQDGFWERAAATRRNLLRKRRRARLADTLIAQACIDNDSPLITRDDDFRHFERYSDLKLL